MNGIIGATEEELSQPSRMGQAFRADGGVRNFSFPDVFPSMTEGSFALWLFNHEYYGASPFGARFFETENPASNGFNIQLGISLGGTATHHRLRFLLQEATRPPNTSPRHVGVTAWIRNWSPGEWRHVAGTWGAGIMRLYIDGRPVAQTAIAADMMDLPGAVTPQKLFLLSSQRSGVANASGKWSMDRFRSFDRPLTADEVTRLYLSEVDRTGPMLAAGRLLVKLLGPQDGYGLESILDRTSGRLVTTEHPPGRWWRLFFSPADEPGPAVTIDSSVSQSPPECWMGPDSVITLRWEFTLPDLALTRNPTVPGFVEMILRPGTDELEARIVGVKHGSQRPNHAWTLNLVAHRLGGLAPLNLATPETTRILLPQHHLGNYVDNATGVALAPFTGGNQGWHNPMGDGNFRYPSGNLAMQWVGLTDIAGRQPALYWGVHDPSGSVKSFFYDNSVGDPYSGSAANRADLIASIPERPGVDLEAVTFASNIGGVANTYTQTWPIVFRLQEGDWWDLAQRYRQFALQQSWTDAGPLATRTDSPDWFQELGLIQTSTIYEGNTPNSGIIKRLEVDMASLGQSEGFDPVGHLLWHYQSWHCEGRAGSLHQTNDLPFFCLDGSFRGRAAQSEAGGTPSAVYTVPTHWEVARDHGSTGGFDYVQWEHLRGWEHAILNRFQDAEELANLPTMDRNVNEPQLQLVAMDLTSTLWRELNLNLYRTLATTSIEGFYLDVLPVGQPRLCYNTQHSHRPGGGDYLVRGAQQLIGDIKTTSAEVRSELKDRLLQEALTLETEANSLLLEADRHDLAGETDLAEETRATATAKQNQAQNHRAREAGLRLLALYGEGFSEPYTDLLDANLVWNLDQLNPRPLPLAMAVYHDYTQFAGRTSSVANLSSSEAAKREDARQVAVARNGQLFIWGGLPGFLFGVFDSGAADSVKLRQYLIRLGRWRRVFKDYLTTGVMLRTPRLALLTTPLQMAPGVQIVGAKGTPAITTLPHLDPASLEEIPIAEASLWSSVTETGVGLVIGSLEIDASASCNPCQVFLAWDGEEIVKRLGSSIATVARVELDGSRTPLFEVDVEFTPGLVVELEPERIMLLELKP